MWPKLLASLIVELLAKASGPITAWLKERQARAQLEADKKAIRDAVANAGKKP